VSPIDLYEGDAITVLRELERAFGVCITSPPYFQKFDYGHPGQYGIELTVADYVERQVAVFHEINRLMAEGGTLFIVIGDTSNNYSPVRCREQRKGTDGQWLFRRTLQKGFREKETLSVPFALADALRTDGWVHRSTMIWDKVGGSEVANSDRAPETHEYILHLIKWSKNTRPYGNTRPLRGSVLRHRAQSHPEHGCVFPESLSDELLSVCPEGCGVIDPYVGSGTVLRSARKTNRPFLGIDLDISLARAAAAEGSLSALPLFAEAAD
jgi:site-specific DNA-methyltransferase (cytosine-N4-specific)